MCRWQWIYHFNLLKTNQTLLQIIGKNVTLLRSIHWSKKKKKKFLEENPPCVTHGKFSLWFRYSWISIKHGNNTETVTKMKDEKNVVFEYEWSKVDHQIDLQIFFRADWTTKNRFFLSHMHRMRDHTSFSIWRHIASYVHRSRYF